MYYIMMNGKQSTHTYRDDEVDQIIERLSGIFPDIVFEKRLVTDDAL